MSRTGQRAPFRTFAADYPARHRIAPHIHRRAQLVFASAGVMRVTTLQGTWVVPPERAVWIPPRVRHQLFMPGPVSMRTLYIEKGDAAGLPKTCSEPAGRAAVPAGTEG